jgi:hypothetical protein
MPSTSAHPLDRVRRARWLGALTVLGVGVLVASLWLHRVKPVSFEDYYGTYAGRLGIPAEIPQDARLPGLPGWFFAVPAAGQVVLAALAARVAMVARLRPERLTASRDLGIEALTIACVLALWVLGAVVLFPGLDAPPFERLAGTWVAAGGAAAAAVGLVGLAATSWSLRHAPAAA